MLTNRIEKAGNLDTFEELVSSSCDQIVGITRLQLACGVSRIGHRVDVLIFTAMIARPFVEKTRLRRERSGFQGHDRGQ